MNEDKTKLMSLKLAQGDKKAIHPNDKFLISCFKKEFKPMNEAYKTSKLLNSSVASFMINSSHANQQPLAFDTNSNNLNPEVKIEEKKYILIQESVSNQNNNNLAVDLDKTLTDDDVSVKREDFHKLQIEVEEEVDSLLVRSDSATYKENRNSDIYHQGRWSPKEHQRFIQAMYLFGNEWKKVQEYIGTRSPTQARSHAQKFFIRLKKKFSLGSLYDDKAIQKKTEKIINWIKESIPSEIKKNSEFCQDNSTKLCKVILNIMTGYVDSKIRKRNMSLTNTLEPEEENYYSDDFSIKTNQIDGKLSPPPNSNYNNNKQTLQNANSNALNDYNNSVKNNEYFYETLMKGSSNKEEHNLKNLVEYNSLDLIDDNYVADSDNNINKFPGHIPTKKLSVMNNTTMRKNSHSFLRRKRKISFNGQKNDAKIFKIVKDFERKKSNLTKDFSKFSSNSCTETIKSEKEINNRIDQNPIGISPVSYMQGSNIVNRQFFNPKHYINIVNINIDNNNVNNTNQTDNKNSHNTQQTPNEFGQKNEGKNIYNKDKSVKGSLEGFGIKNMNVRVKNCDTIDQSTNGISLKSHEILNKKGNNGNASMMSNSGNNFEDTFQKTQNLNLGKDKIFNKEINANITPGHLESNYISNNTNYNKTQELLKNLLKQKLLYQLLLRNQLNKTGNLNESNNNFNNTANVICNTKVNNGSQISSVGNYDEMATIKFNLFNNNYTPCTGFNTNSINNIQFINTAHSNNYTSGINFTQNCSNNPNLQTEESINNCFDQDINLITKNVIFDTNIDDEKNLLLFYQRQEDKSIPELIVENKDILKVKKKDESLTCNESLEFDIDKYFKSD